MRVNAGEDDGHFDVKRRLFNLSALRELLLVLAVGAFAIVFFMWAGTWLFGLRLSSQQSSLVLDDAEADRPYRQHLWQVSARRGGVLIDRLHCWYAAPNPISQPDATTWGKARGQYPVYPRYGAHKYHFEGLGFQWVTGGLDLPHVGRRWERWIIVFPLWPFILVLSVPLFVAVRRWRRMLLRVRRRRRGRCVTCGYDLVATPGRCPECGTDAALLELYQKGEITYDTALSAARDPTVIRHKSS